MLAVSASNKDELLDELKSLADLIGVHVVEAVKLPIVTIKVTSGGVTSIITKRGDSFLATEDLPEISMTFVGGGRFKYRVEI